MHKFLRSIGFSGRRNDQDVEELLQKIIADPTEQRKIQLDESTNLCEIRGEAAPGMGIAIYGKMDADGNFHREFYYPYLTSGDLSSEADCSIQRHTEKETYAGLLDEYRVGISLIFFLENLFEYRQLSRDQRFYKIAGVNLTGLSLSGKVLLPLRKTAKQIELSKVAARDRSSLIEAAKNGDEDAMETLTIEDIDLYSKISRRMIKEDVYSIVETCFMPCGIECDQYSVIGEIKNVAVRENSMTGEEVYDLTIESSDVLFHVGIAKADLLGEPEPGRRFKGQIWMQGVVKFEA